MSSLDSVKYFDDVAAEYAARYEASTPGGYALRIRQQRVLEMLDQPGGRVLDLGCGPGVLARELVHRGYEVWGVDAAYGMIRQCRRRLADTESAHFAVADIAELSLPDQFFDVVICTGVIDQGAHQQTAMREMVRVAKEGGILLVSFPNVLSPQAIWKSTVFYPLMALLRPAYYRMVGRPEPATLYRFQTFRSVLSYFDRLRTVRRPTSLIEGLGAVIVDVVYFNYNLFLSPLDEIFPRLALRLTEALEPFHTGKVKWLGAGFIIKARILSRAAARC